MLARYAFAAVTAGESLVIVVVVDILSRLDWNEGLVVVLVEAETARKFMKKLLFLIPMEVVEKDCTRVWTSGGRTGIWRASRGNKQNLFKVVRSEEGDSLAKCALGYIIGAFLDQPLPPPVAIVRFVKRKCKWRHGLCNLSLALHWVCVEFLALSLYDGTPYVLVRPRWCQIPRATHSFAREPIRCDMFPRSYDAHERPYNQTLALIGREHSEHAGIGRIEGWK